MELGFRLERESFQPLYVQIKEHLHRLIEKRLLLPGVKLPPSRDLAQQLQVTRSTINSAYSALLSEGLVVSEVGRGTFVSGKVAAPASGAEAGQGPEPDLPGVVDWDQQFSRRGLLPEPSFWPGVEPFLLRPQTISFIGGVPDSALFPIDLFRKVLNAALKKEGKALLQYGNVSGYPPLKRYLSTYLLGLGIEAPERSILIVNGSQQGLDLLARVLLDPGDAVVVENPSYPGALDVFRSNRAELLPVPMGEDGLSREALGRILQRQRPKLIYTIPTFHNPTGITLSAEGRRELLALAARHQVPIVEDDYDGELRYEGPRLLSLKGLDPADLVIYTGTFSKILFPGLRLGWIVGPEPVMERLRAAKQISDLQTSPVLQAALYHFCQKGLLTKHMEHIRKEYRGRRDLLLESLQKHMPAGVSWTRPVGGLSLMVRLPDPLNSLDLLPRAAEEGVVFLPGPVFFAAGGGERELRLSFSAVPAGRIEEGVRRLARVVRRMIADQKNKPPRPRLRERAPVL
ncbi:MAG: PLP-dependent aminotransferase family protein [Candidatus Tectomicrobia bacterium]|uniref:PLP-dependent aminotransferase family protein n=1 Tax=Tectimicrobiota bacterium TaxID=2528274 RepID=A0A932GRX7_UNCTE|nr:PLP-dependent aminotransferase family protein [Candidatus Tectomicrobia bacterium]